jgi:hypothetical protein
LVIRVFFHRENFEEGWWKKFLAARAQDLSQDLSPDLIEMNYR